LEGGGGKAKGERRKEKGERVIREVFLGINLCAF
jgi:hypothetical protein